jgi:hypothetical protein
MGIKSGRIKTNLNNVKNPWDDIKFSQDLEKKERQKQKSKLKKQRRKNINVSESFQQKLEGIFEGMSDKTFSYEKQREKKEIRNNFMKDFEKEGKKYVDQMKDVYSQGNEHTVRKELYKIQDEIINKLKTKEEYKGLKIPDLIAKLRVVTQGFEDQRSPIIT